MQFVLFVCPLASLPIVYLFCYSEKNKFKPTFTINHQPILNSDLSWIVNANYVANQNQSLKYLLNVLFVECIYFLCIMLLLTKMIFYLILLPENKSLHHNHRRRWQPLQKAPTIQTLHGGDHQRDFAAGQHHPYVIWRRLRERSSPHCGSCIKNKQTMNYFFVISAFNKTWHPRYQAVVNFLLK